MSKHPLDAATFEKLYVENLARAGICYSAAARADVDVVVALVAEEQPKDVELRILKNRTKP